MTELSFGILLKMKCVLGCDQIMIYLTNAINMLIKSKKQVIIITDNIILKCVRQIRGLKLCTGKLTKIMQSKNFMYYL